MWLLLSSIAFALPEAQLVEGVPEFTDCLGDPSCEARFGSFLAGSTIDQAFSMRPGPMVASAAIASVDGVVVGARLDTFPLGPPPTNLSGKEENTSFSPVLPRLVAAYGASDVSAHVGFLPAIPVGGASAWVVSGGVTAGKDVGGARLGGELDFGFVRARAPIAATQEQLESRDDFSNPDNLDPETFAENCGDSDCLDTFVVAEPSLRGVVAVPAGAFTPFAKLGVTFINERLEIAYDQTAWRVRGAQPSLTVGSTLQVKKLGLALGGALAPNVAKSATGLTPLSWRLEGEAGVRF